MKNCTHCAHAAWDKTTSGRLSPTGDGRCTFVVKVPELPQAFYWATMGKTPTPAGGYINRKSELKDHCAYYAHKVNS